MEQDGALQFESTDSNQFFLKGRGELHLGIVLENMRREGYEFQTTSPTVIFKEGPNGTKLEPFEQIKFEVPLSIISKIMDKIQKRLGNVTDTLESG